MEGLLQGAPKLVMMAEGVQRGAYQAGKPATHTGQILYPQCKRGVLPPSDWDPSLAKRSTQLPEASLALDFVHGYDGFQATSANLFYNSAGEWVGVSRQVLGWCRVTAVWRCRCLRVRGVGTRCACDCSVAGAECCCCSIGMCHIWPAQRHLSAHMPGPRTTCTSSTPCTAPAAGELVYYAAGVGIVYQQASHSQRFFTGHDDDILCLALAPDRATVATGQAGKDPAVIVWDSLGMKQLQRLQHGYGARGIQVSSRTWQ